MANNTRLDRLLNLLATGATATVRDIAAEQLGQIAGQRIQHASSSQSQPGERWHGVDGEWAEIAGLIGKILPYLLNKSAPTRTAAANAIREICNAVGVWDPTFAENGAKASLAAERAGTVDNLAKFDLYNVISTREPLLASAGDEFQSKGAVYADNARKEMLGSLGLDANMEIDLDEGLDHNGVAAKAGKPVAKVKTQSAPEVQPETNGLSAREKAALKLKRKRQGADNAPNKAAKLETPISKSTKMRSGSVETEARPENIDNKVVIQHRVKAKIELDDAVPTPEANAWATELHVWPFAKVVARLQADLVSPVWTARHGSALGLAAILSAQGKNMGKVLGQSRAENIISHDTATSLIAARLLTVFALDRFGDYVGDTVSAPVREAAGTALSNLLAGASPSIILEVRKHLMTMVKQDQMASTVKTTGALSYVWQIRHAGLLGMRCVLEAIDTDSAGAEIVEDALAVAILGLKDSDDDVRSAAASSLTPISALLAELPEGQLTPLLRVLWDSLSAIDDDLASSVAAVLDLLSQLNAQPKAFNYMAKIGLDVRMLVARLYPFFRHVIPHVRSAVIANMKLLLQHTDKAWIDAPLLGFLVQNILLEEKLEIVEASSQVLTECWTIAAQTNPNFQHWISAEVCPFSANWMAMITTPPSEPFNPALFVRIDKDSNGSHDIDKAAMQQDPMLISEDRVYAGRLIIIRFLATMASAFSAEDLRRWIDACVVPHLVSKNAFRISMAAIFLAYQSYGRLFSAGTPALETISARLQELGESEGKLNIEEAQTSRSRLNAVLDQLTREMVTTGKIPAASIPNLSSQTVAEVASFLSTGFDRLIQRIPKTTAKKALPLLSALQADAVAALAAHHSMAEKHEVRVLSTVASALVSCRMIPSKISPVIKGLMNSVKVETIESLQELSAASLADFIAFCSSSEFPLKVNPADKIVKNVCTFLCQDTDQTPLFAVSKLQSTAVQDADEDAKSGKSMVDTVQLSQGQIVRRGADLCLKALSATFGAALFDKLPRLKQSGINPFLHIFAESTAAGDQIMSNSDEFGQALLDACTILPLIVQHAHTDLRMEISQAIPSIARGIGSSIPVVRLSVAKALARLCDAMPIQGLGYVIETLLPNTIGSNNQSVRRGASQLISDIVEALDVRILPFLVFFIAPTLQGMTAGEDDIRRSSSKAFAILVKLMPLEAATDDLPDMPDRLRQQRVEQRGFISQLLNGAKSEPYQIPVEIKADLRPYQKEGVSWLAFLAKYALHGILCDDMGLGKTLQTICILASSAHQKGHRQASLVICPPTLTGHWAFEIERYTANLRVAIFSGHNLERQRVLANLKDIDVVVVAYETARNSIVQLSAVHWNYCVLDEGHIIKNSKTKLSQALKQLRADHRLILSGTPVQNNVLELWNLFDFLMPGFLGSEKSFSERYGRPIAASRDAKSSSKQQAAGTLALEALHKQVLPFLLRRLKEDVLDDLPPKIIQDYYCDLSPLQRRFYEAASNDTLDGEAGQQHVFATMQYLRKLVNHPLLVLDKISAELDSEKRASPVNIRDLAHAPKLLALQQILLDCGIGDVASNKEDTMEEAAVAPHRVLIFCQMKQMLDIIEEDLFGREMPTITFMRLDGDTPVNKRHATVQAFNADPSIDVLLLTTHVGGLGLTLTGADTVIFVEHDWNPMKDLQAMDRAHRLGQKRVVNVYRLIMRDTLEEKIMSLQKFKLNIASSVVNEQNSGLGTMDTDQVLDLFDNSATSTGPQRKQVKMSRKEIMNGLGELEADDA